MLGRIIHLTDDGYIAINIPAKAKTIQLLWQGKKPYLKYKVGKETKTMSLSFQNMPVLQGSYLVGTFDGKSYEPEALAELMDFDVKDITDETHTNLLTSIQKGNIYFNNPHRKPKATVDKKSPQYLEWKSIEDALWEQACVIYLSDPMREAAEERARKLAEQKPAAATPPATIEEPVEENTPAAPAPEPAAVAEEKEEEEIEPIKMAEEQTALLLANLLFEDGTTETIGLNAALAALRKKELTHDGLKKIAFALFKQAFYEGKKFEAERTKPVADFLIALRDRNIASKETMQATLGLDADTEKIFDDELTRLNKQILLLAPVTND